MNPQFSDTGPADKEEPNITPGRYRHYKGKNYQVIGIAKHSETEETLVIYRALYSAYDLWARPVEMFTEKVMIDGKLISRFEKLPEEDEA